MSNKNFSETSMVNLTGRASCKLSLYANEHDDEHAILFLAMIKSTRHVHHVFD